MRNFANFTTALILLSFLRLEPLDAQSSTEYLDEEAAVLIENVAGTANSSETINKAATATAAALEAAKAAEALAATLGAAAAETAAAETAAAEATAGYIRDQYSSNTYGGIGLIQTPTARFSDDGEISIGVSHETPFNRLFAKVQMLPWLEGVVRYTEGEYKAYNPGSHQSFKDKGLDLKIKLFEESDNFPQIAIGLTDVGGTGVDSTEYIVATKKYKNFDYTIGIGWGALAGREHIKNPFSYISDKFNTRPTSTKEGGSFNIGKWFSGKKAAFFGGIEYFSPLSNLSYKIEYDSKSYEELVGKETIFDKTGDIFRVDSPFNFGLTYRFKPTERDTVDFSLGYVRGNTLYASALAHSNFNFAPKNRYRPPWGDLKRKSQTSLANLTDQSHRNLVELIMWQMGNEGFITHKVIFKDSEMMAEISHSRFLDTVTAINLAGIILANNAPKDIETITVINNDHGMQTMSASIPYDTLAKVLTKAKEDGIEQYLYLYEEKLAFDTVYLSDKTNQIVSENEYLYPNFYWQIKPSLNGTLQHQVKFYFWQLQLAFNSELAIRRGLFLKTTYGLNLANNFETYTWGTPDGELHHVRQHRRQYLRQGESGLRKMKIDYTIDFSRNIKANFTAGILEWMFGGFGGEVIYIPDHRKWAIGADLYWVKQRSYEQKFSFFDYETVTGFLSYYYDLPFYNMRFKTSVGRFLGKDVGAQVDLSRRFATGATVGAAFALTDCDAECVGEGSFSKWVYFTLPMNLFYTNSQARGSAAYSWSPLTKDAGAKLETVNLYGAVISAADEVESLRKKQWSFKKIISGFGTSPKTKI